MIGLPQKGWKAEKSSLRQVALARPFFVCRGPFVDKYAERLGRLFRKPIRDSEIRKRLAKGNGF